MRAEAVPRSAWPTAPIANRILTTDVRTSSGSVLFSKGHVLSDADRLVVLQGAWDQLHLVAVDADDCPEAEAGRRVAAAVCGEGVVVGDFAGGQWPVRAAARGILRVDADALSRVNACDDLAVYTLYDGQVVDTGETVARAKVVPFAVAKSVVRNAERLGAKGGPIVSVQPFLPLRIAAIVQESLGARGVRRFHETFGEKVAWFGGTLDTPRHVEPCAEPLTRAFHEVLASRPHVVVVAGSRAMDPLDPVFEALSGVGARMIRRGMPAHPGSLCWVAESGGSMIVGMPSCGVFAQATVFDLLLTWLFAGLSLDASRLAAVGHGGFLTRDMSFRFPPYRQARDRGAVEVEE
jgi:hypothetical protein